MRIVGLSVEITLLANSLESTAWDACSSVSGLDYGEDGVVIREDENGIA